MLVEIEGLEPSLTEPESVVLPLHHISICPANGTANVRHFSETARAKVKKLRFLQVFGEGLLCLARYLA